MAKRLLRLLIGHPTLVGELGDQQLEILAQSPHLRLVQELIALSNISSARHAGALLRPWTPSPIWPCAGGAGHGAFGRGRIA